MTSSARIFWPFVACLAWLGVLATAAEPAAIGMHMEPLRTKKLSHYRGHEQETLRERMVRFQSGERHYGISYKAGYREDRPGKAFPLEGYIGMPSPTACNWYHSGFLDIRVNGRSIGATALSSFTIVERGKRGIADLVWHAEQASVRVRFVMLPGTDALFCEITIETPKPTDRVELALRCYPSFFTSHHKRVGARLIQTPEAQIKEGEKSDLPMKGNEWALYSDGVFDVDRGEGRGPCALLLPSCTRTVHFAPGGYSVETRIECTPGTQTVRMAFWDWKGLTNAQASAKMPDEARVARAVLDTVDFTPAALADADLEAMREDCRQALASPEAKKMLAKKLESIQAWLENMPEKRSADASIRAQEGFLRAADEFEQFRWEIKLVKLISDL
ncbi:MAG: hypothetical protein KAI66_13195 [Lentisphaeria bacterium]|nr:hypothetical protein [Lentisphaeria bacterium]